MKKMRKLLPAFAMLLVSAIMMSTASFAWFTMNEQVTATGMSVQAKANGSMVIGTTKLDMTKNDVTVGFGHLSTVKLNPITWNATSSQWETPKNTASVDPVTGKYTGDMLKTTPVEGQHYAEYSVYLAVAGDSVSKKIKVTLEDEATDGVDIAPAYTIAFYVVRQDGSGNYADVAADAAPVATLNVLKGATGTNIIDTAELIPSTAGVASPDGVGIKVIMRVFVDGALVKGQENINVPTYTQVEAAAKYNNTLTYYVKNGEKYEVAPTFGLSNGDEIDDNWYTMSLVPTPMDIYYVNNGYAPIAPTGLTVEFSLVD